MRVTVSANTVLSEAEFRQGWFPANAVDALFGDVSQKSGADAARVRNDIRGEIDAALTRAYKAFLAEVTKDEPDHDVVRERLKAIERVRLAPASDALASGARLIEYRHHDHETNTDLFYTDGAVVGRLRVRRVGSRRGTL